MSYLAAGISSWFIFRIQIIGSLILLFISILVFMGINPGFVGLAISYALSICNGLQGVVFTLSWFENCMVCPERILQYVDIPGEVIYNNNNNNDNNNDNNGGDIELGMKTSSSSSSSTLTNIRGKIEFLNVYFRYQPDDKFTLTDLSFKINEGEKVGVVGRTGSGKTSILMALFRIADISTGNILIDDIDTQSISLKELRSTLEIIPQNPVIFKGL
jgi:ABC-type multidrug transport system fused ATPase/permease subunit